MMIIQNELQCDYVVCIKSEKNLVCVAKFVSPLKAHMYAASNSMYEVHYVVREFQTIAKYFEGLEI